MNNNPVVHVYSLASSNYEGTLEQYDGSYIGEHHKGPYLLRLELCLRCPHGHNLTCL